MKNKIDLTKILKEGDKVYSALHGNCVTIKRIETGSVYPLKIGINTEQFVSLNKYGVYSNELPEGECLIWPDENTRSWENYCPFKRGDLVVMWDYEGSVKSFCLFGKKSDGYHPLIIHRDIIEVSETTYNNCELFDTKKYKL